MSITKVFLSITLLLSAPGFSQDPNAYPASVVPDRILLSVGQDPATSAGLSWRMDSTVVSGYAELVPAKAAPEADNTLKFPAVIEKLSLPEGSAHYFSVDLSGLSPNTLYMYRVGDEKNRSEWIQFRTASKEFRPFSFLYVGDAQNEHKTWWSRTIRAAYSHEPGAAFLVHAGDLINRSNVDREWGEWFYAGGWMHGMIPTVATAGNHEFYRDEQKRLTLTKHWRPVFNLPENGPAGLEELAYYFDYQNVRVISLSSQSLLLNPADSISQVKWLEEVLKYNPCRWTILTMHHPIFSAGTGRDNKSLRDALQSIFEKYPVDLVLTGHDHTYGRGVAEKSPQQKRQPLKGPVYVVSVSGPKMYMPSLEPWLQRVAANTQLYQRVKVEANKIRLEAYTVTGELYDAFDIVKNKRGEKKLVDWAPGLTKEYLDLPASYRARLKEEEKAAYEKKKQEYLKRKH